MARIPVSGVRTSWAKTANAASTTPREAFSFLRLRARPAGMRFFAGRFLLRDFTAMIPLQTPGAGFRMAWPDGRSHGGVWRCTPGNLRER